MRRAILLLFFVLQAGAISLLAQADTARLPTVIIVRHAEKDSTRVDPSLSEAGRDRARRLANMLTKSDVTSIVVTQLRRTQETAAPLSALLGISPTVVPVDHDSLDDHVHRLLETIADLPPDGKVLIISHSNVIPRILRALGIDESILIEDNQYDDLFVVTEGGTGRVQMVRLRYGHHRVGGGR